MTKRAPPNWERARDEYAHCPDALAIIAERNGISRSGLQDRAKQEGWERKVETIPRERYDTKKIVPRGASPRPEQRRLQRLLKWLYKILEQKVRIMEQRIALASEPGAEPQSAADIERDIRSINAMAKAFAQVIELEERARASGESEKEETSSGVPEDADELRRDLARRLERMHRSGTAE